MFEIAAGASVVESLFSKERRRMRKRREGNKRRRKTLPKAFNGKMKHFLLYFSVSRRF